MYYKQDWPSSKKRLEAFWNREMPDRACIGILAPRKTSRAKKFPHLTHGPWLGGLEKFKDTDKEEITRWWTDPELNYQRMKFWFENTYFGGEAVPATYINWGASAGCAFWGAEPDFNTRSVWFHKVIDDWNKWEGNFNIQSNKYFRIIQSIMDVFVERNREEYFIGVPEIGNAADNLSLIRGASDLAMDLILNPEAVKHAVDTMSDAWVEVEKIFFRMSEKANEGGGVLAWLNLWAPGSHDQIANDFSSMISSHDFEEFFFPELRKMGGYLDYATYHLDGPQCIRNHADILLTLNEIRCIQFTPGAGSPPTSDPDYIPIFQKIQKAGKNLYLLVDPSEIQFILDNLSARGLFLNTWADSEDEATELIKKVEKWSVDRY
ncbi:MAG: hypothetical protein IH594_06085 [Bacteroidales bacterium]|nr:hypothetical protein [Bacteroidales bacterium]